MSALIALMLAAAPEDVPVVTPAVTEALAQFGQVARSSAEPGADRVFASAGCGSGWSSYSLQWQRPGDKGPRRWGPPAKPQKPDAAPLDANLIAAAGDLCDSFQAALTEDQFFEVDWSIKDGVVNSVVGPIKDLNKASPDQDAQQHILAFFGTTPDQMAAIPRKARR